MTETDILDLVCGLKDGEPRASFCVQTAWFDVTSDRSTIKDSFTADTAQIEIFRGYDFTMVDFIFPEDANDDLNQLYSLLSSFTVPENSLEETAERIPTILVTLDPDEYLNTYLLEGVHPAWCLTSSDGSNTLNMIRFTFVSEHFQAYELDPDDIDEEELKQEIAMEESYGSRSMGTEEDVEEQP